MKRNALIDGYRFIFIIVICILHIKEYSGNSQPPMAGGYLAVEFFLILSGWLLIKHYDSEVKREKRPDVVKFFVYRYKRLFPQYAVGFILLSIIDILFFEKYNFLAFISSYLWEFFMLQITGLGAWHFDLFWYVSALLVASVVIYYLLINDREKFISVYAPIIVLLIYSWFYQTRHCVAGIGLSTNTFIVSDGFWRALAGMSVGCIAYALRFKVEKYLDIIFPKPSIQKIVLTISEMFLLFICFIDFYGKGCSERDFVLIVCMALLITFAFINKSYLATVCMDNKILFWLGNISYTMYCTHMIVNNIIRAYFPGYPFWTTVACYLIVVIILSTGINWLLKVAQNCIKR